MIAVEIIKIEQIPNNTKATDFFFQQFKNWPYLIGFKTSDKNLRIPMKIKFV